MRPVRLIRARRRGPRGTARRATRQARHVPEVGNDHAPAQAQSAFQGRLEIAQGRRGERAGRGEALELSVAAAHRDERDHGRTLLEGPGRRAHGPDHALVRGHEGRPHEDERANSDVRLAQAIRRASEVGEACVFAEERQRLGWIVSRPIATSSCPGIRFANSKHASSTRRGWHSTVTPANGRTRSATTGRSSGGTARGSKKLLAL